MSYITISPKHGVNPSMGVCFWCGKSDNTILLMGRLPEDKEAPREIFHSYEPCEGCAKKFALGFVIIEATASPNFDGQPEIQSGIYPTGRWWVLKSEVAKLRFSEENTQKGKAFLEPEVARKLGLYNDNQGESHDHHD